MNLANVDVERIVREVLARLETFQPSTPAVPNAPSPKPVAPADLMVEAQVVSLETLKGRLDGVRTIAVGARAVLTPAVRDLLREKGIAVVRRTAGNRTSSKPAVALGGDATPGATTLAQWLTSGGYAVERVANSGLPTVTAEVAQLVARGGMRGVLLTTQTHAAVCLANRVRGVRAAAARGPAEVDTLVRQIGCNLLVLDSQQSWVLLRRCVERLLVPDAIEAPRELQNI